MIEPEAISGFQRASVGDQVAASLWEAIRRRVWRSFLPGEHELARRFGTSRDSVRIALAQLNKEGRIVIRKGRRTEISARSRPRLPIQHPTVCIVSSGSGEPYAGIGRHPVILELHAQLADSGIAWEEVCDTKLGGENPGRRLGQLVANRRRVCWLLVSTTVGIQRWFQNAGVPAMVFGSCHAGVELPSVDTDHRAVGWHAAGCMAKKGHRNVALVLPPEPLPGDWACRDGFADYLLERKEPILSTAIIAGPTLQALESKLDSLFRSSRRPTAIMSMRPEITLAVFSHLTRRGLQIPGDVSLLSRDTHHLFTLGLSRLTRYNCPATIQACRRVVRMAQSLLAGRPVQPNPSWIMPTFIPGATLGDPPATLTRTTL